MGKDRYFVVGGGALQQDFVETVKRLGFETHVFDYNPECPCARIANVFHCISIGAQDKILAIALELKPVAIQTVATEMGNISACYVGEKMGLHTNSYKTALDTTDKTRMKKIFVEKGIPTAKFAVVSDIAEVQPDSLHYPVVVKAADRSAGRGVMRVNDTSGFQAAFDDALEESGNKRVLVEECLEGSQYSVETVSSGGRHQIVAITEETFDGTDNLIETRHMLPAHLSQAHFEMIADLAVKTLVAFNVRYGAGHIEIKMTRGGPKVIEIASRAGGLRDFMVRRALGCDFNRLVVDASLGHDIHVQHAEHKYVVSVFLIREADYALYKKMKKDFPQRVIRENVHAFDTSSAPKTLMDSQGVFYLLFDHQEEAENIIRRDITP